MQIVFFTNDLVFPSRVAGMAKRLNAELAVVGSVEAMLARISEDADPTRVVVLDLNCPAVDPAQVVPALKATANPPRVVAFGPHVHEAKLALARDAGCDLVLTRGQFDAQTELILTRFLSD